MKGCEDGFRDAFGTPASCLTASGSARTWYHLDTKEI